MKPITKESSIIFTGKDSDKKYWSVSTYSGPLHATVHIKVTDRINGKYAEGKSTGSIFKLHAKLIEVLEKQ